MQIRQRETFDSSATPKAGARRIEPRVLAPVDLERLRARIASTRDPTGATPERAGRFTQPELRIERVEVPVLAEDDLRALREAVVALRATGDALLTAVARIEAALDRWSNSDPVRNAGASAQTATDRLAPARRKHPAAPARVEARPQPSQPEAEMRLRAGERRILAALAVRHPVRLTRAQVATLAGLTSSSGSFASYWSHLKSLGLILEHPTGLVEITPAGLACLGTDAPKPPQTTEELQAMWRERLPAGAQRMLDVVIEAYPGWVTRSELGERAGLTPTSGSFGSYLGLLRRNGLADVQGDRVRAGQALFL